MIERSVVNLKSESTNRSNFDKSNNKQKNSKTKDSFKKILEKDKHIKKNQEKSSKKLEKKQLKESEKPKNKETEEEQDSNTDKKEEDIVEIVSFINIKDLPKESKNNQKSAENLEGNKIPEKFEKLENIKNVQAKQENLKIEINTEKAEKLGKEEVLLEKGKEIKGEENLNLKDLKGLNKTEKEKNSEIKLEDVKATKQSSEKNKVQTLKDDSSLDNEFKEELNKKLENLTKNINSIDDKKEEKETTFSENLKSNIEGAKENFNKEKIMTEAQLDKSTEKPISGKENIIDQLAKNITTGKTEKGNFIKIQLKPEVLGEMTVKLTEGKEGMIATISAEKEVVKNILRNSGEQITTMLTEKNIKVNNVVIETNESEKQDFNLFDGTGQEDFTGEENTKENFTNSRFPNYGKKLETEPNSTITDEIYSGKGINFYV